jgi:hypothetical protein
VNKLIKRHKRGIPIVELGVIRAVLPPRAALPTPGSKQWELVPGGEVAVHRPEVCDGEACVFHRPSGHNLREYNPVWYAPIHQALMRNCRHGQWHWDPDSLAYFERPLGTQYPQPGAFHVLPWGPGNGIMGQDTPRCLTGSCCGCCGPKSAIAHEKWRDTVYDIRNRRFREWVDAETDRKRREREESERLMRQQSNSYTKASASYTWKVMNNSTTWSSVNGVWNGSP